MEALQKRVETWIRDQTQRIPKLSWPPRIQLNNMKWPPWKNRNEEREQRRILQEEYDRRKNQLQDLCHAVKAESLSDLQDILCSMVLSECVYKRPATEIIRAVNKFKADFGGQVVSLERVQPSLDHVSHRYLLAEAGDTLFASFIGTKQYKDFFADANILQGAIFHEEFAEDIEENEIADCGQVQDQSHQSKTNKQKHEPKPAAHRGFLARAKGIPALELYRLAQKKNRKLVLCGHSMGGAVAALATLAILRVIATASSAKENNKVQVKCITFSQPPVGNAALRDYVHRKGWRHYFKTYCIPEDLVPRILSPAYFHHYNAQPPMPNVEGVTNKSKGQGEEGKERLESTKLKENGGEQLVLGLGPVQKSFWRLSRLVPLHAVQEHINRFRREGAGVSSLTDAGVTSTIDEVDDAQSLEIQEGADGISLKPLPSTDKEEMDKVKSNKVAEISVVGSEDPKRWQRVPYLPSYVPFGQLYILGISSVESLSPAEYSKLTSVKSVFAELRERLQSHSMKSYRSRFQKIYDLCMCSNTPFLGLEQLSQFPNLQQWLGLTVAGAVELGSIVEPPIIRTATSIIPLGWTGVSGGKNGEPFKVDITGYGLHLCTLIQAYVNGYWCSTTVESIPPMPNYSSDHELKPDMQKMRILVGAPVRNNAKHQAVTDALLPAFPAADMESINSSMKYCIGSSHEGENHPEGLSSFVIFCTSDFTTVSKEVFVRIRKVQLVGLEGAGKTSLLNAILGQGRSTTINLEAMHPEIDRQEGTTGGLCFLDSAGINLQDLNSEVARFRDKLWMGIHDLSRKTDLIVLVHNLSHKVPRYHQLNASQSPPALSLLLNEAKALGIPWILAITNKFSVSAHQQRTAVNAVIEAYQASRSMSEVINSCPYVMPGASASAQAWSAVDDGASNERSAPQRFIFNPINLARMPFQKKTTVLPVDGVTSLCQLIHRVLQNNEEASFEVVEAAKHLHLKEHAVLDGSGNVVKLAAPVECKGIVGSDDRHYLLDLMRATPRDANYTGAQSRFCVLRPELVSAFCEAEAAERIKKSKSKSKSEETHAESNSSIPEASTEATAVTSNSEDTPEREKVEAAPEVDSVHDENGALSEGILLNPNVLTEFTLSGSQDEIDGDEECVRKAGDYLKNVVLPKFVQDLCTLEVSPMDGQTLTEALHAHGINVRYIGKVGDMTKHLPHIWDLCAVEIVIRSAKHILKDILRDSQDHDIGNTIAHFLNCFFGHIQPLSTKGTTSNSQSRSQKKDILRDSPDMQL